MNPIKMRDPRARIISLGTSDLPPKLAEKINPRKKPPEKLQGRQASRTDACFPSGDEHAAEAASSGVPRPKACIPHGNALVRVPSSREISHIHGSHCLCRSGQCQDTHQRSGRNDEQGRSLHARLLFEDNIFTIAKSERLRRNSLTYLNHSERSRNRPARTSRSFHDRFLDFSTKCERAALSTAPCLLED